MNVSYKEIRNYLNHLYKIKSKIKFPINLEIEDGLYHILDGEGKRILTCSKDIYDVFQEL